MLDPTRHIVETKAGHLEPQKFEDQYETALKELSVQIGCSGLAGRAQLKSQAADAARGAASDLTKVYLFSSLPARLLLIRLRRVP